MAEGRRNHFFCCGIIFQADFLKITEHFRFSYLCSQQCIDLLSVKRHSDRFFYFPVYVYGSAHYFSCAHLFYQLAGTVNCSFCIVRVQALFKLAGCIRTQSYSLAGLPDIYPVKAGSLKQHRLYIVCNHRVFSAHDSRDADLFLAVADHQHFFVQLSFLPVKGGKLIPILCGLNDNLSSRNGVQVIGMHRLAVLFHYIVRNIDQIIDRTDSHRCQPSLHPFR